jgi:two-component system chemotaxis sensor kinase CheA
VSKLDALMAQLSELLVAKIRSEQRLDQMRRLQDFATAWQKEWRDARKLYSRLTHRDIRANLGMRQLEPVEATKAGSPGQLRRSLIAGSVGGKDHEKVGKDILRLLDYANTAQERLREIGTMIHDLTREYTNDTMHMSLVISRLEEEVKHTRMLPFDTITASFGRMVRDLAREAGKEAVLHIVGSDTEMDKQVLEQIKDPLIHLLRNAVDHGIELPEQRAALGKPRWGTITLTAERRGQSILIRVSDDGAGLDLDAIRQVVARRGRGDTSSLDETDLVEAIFDVGISTKPIITDVSGRGVGLDVVRRNVEALRGRIEVDWTRGGGVTFGLALPMALTSSHALLVSVSGQPFAIPLDGVERLISIKPDEIISLEGHSAVRYNGQPLTLVNLGDVLGLAPVCAVQDGSLNTPASGPRILAVVLTAVERRIAFVVDEFIGEHEVVIKGLGRQLTSVGGIAGATVMGSGEVVLILNVADLIKLGVRSRHRPVLDVLSKTASAEPASDRQHILIVDDSITTRTLERNILEAAGYSVQLATDGQEAWDAIAAGDVPDLVVADVIMPRLDGFDLTRRLKNEPGTADVPVILVTSLDSPGDKALGIEAGADAYITKNSFDQNNLLETIRQLI